MNHAAMEPGILPLPLPPGRIERVVLVCIRRMATHGIRDAHAAWLALDTFGVHFRRPLVLMRAFLIELARGSERTIRLAPCCALRMTEDEGRILQVLENAAFEPRFAADALSLLTADGCAGEAMSVAALFQSTMQELKARRAP